MGQLRERLATGRVLVADGAWGTMLHDKGMGPTDCPEEWNVSHPDAVRAVAADYAAAGADLVLTNSFGGSRPKLTKMGLAEQVVAFNAAAAANSLARADAAIVGASIGPTGEFMEPLGTISANEMEAIFAEQIGALVGAGVRVVCVETMSALEEACCAVRAARAIDADIDVSASMTFEHSPTGYHTMMGVTPEQAVIALREAGADVVGSNCGNGIDAMIPIAQQMRAVTDAPLLFNANAGMPEIVEGKTVFRMGPEAMAARVESLVAAGATIVGGCCGTTPAHIAAIRAAVDALG
ncbi:MAG: homocysteine S-methyltransferase family protein [Planctomycetota bacterium]